jgi:NADH:ubiquinone oxidoreductase subunit 5 (subunit L)/multisubunit Na+/H+ antiporter MnhA subunit
MIYQGIIESGQEMCITSKLWVIWLGLAVLGSALTLASFIKFIGGIFLSRSKASFEKVREVPPVMWIPLIILALFLYRLRIFATKLYRTEAFHADYRKFCFFRGFWNSSLVSLLVNNSLILGILFYLILNIKKFRREDSFIGGERIQIKQAIQHRNFIKTIGEFDSFHGFTGKLKKSALIFMIFPDALFTAE